MCEQAHDRHDEAAASADRIMSKLFGSGAMTPDPAQADQPAEGTCATCRWAAVMRSPEDRAFLGIVCTNQLSPLLEIRRNDTCPEHERTPPGGDNA